MLQLHRISSDSLKQSTTNENCEKKKKEAFVLRLTFHWATCNTVAGKVEAIRFAICFPTAASAAATFSKGVRHPFIPAELGDVAGHKWEKTWGEAVHQAGALSDNRWDVECLSGLSTQAGGVSSCTDHSCGGAAADATAATAAATLWNMLEAGLQGRMIITSVSHLSAISGHWSLVVMLLITATLEGVETWHHTIYPVHFLYLPLPALRVSGSTGTSRRCQWVKAGWHPAQVASSLQGHNRKPTICSLTHTSGQFRVSNPPRMHGSGLW